jgi:hypothetical protein
LKKLPTIRVFLLILLALFISSNSLVSISVAQEQEKIGIQDKLTVSVNRGVPVTDVSQSNEPNISLQFHDAGLNQKVQDLTNETFWLSIYGIVISIAGIGAGFLGYFLSRRHLESTIDKAVEKTVTKTVEKTVEVANAQLRVKDGGKVAIRENEIIGAHERNITEPHIPVTDGISTKVIRAKDLKIVAENKKEFKVDVVLVNADETKLDDTKADKSEHKEKKDDLSKGVKLDH